MNRSPQLLCWFGAASLVAVFATACGGESITEPGDGAGGSPGVGGTGNTSGTGGTPGTGGDNPGGTGGGTSVGGTGGTGGTVPIVHADKVDLLFMVDNSASMLEKQKVLATVVPDLVHQLAAPPCVDSAGNFVTQAGPGEACPAGSERSFPPVTDMHIGVITSSLGGHGADSCSNEPTQNWNPRKEDMAHLISRGAPTEIPTYQNQGFLNWDPTQSASPPGESDINVVVERFSAIVTGADQDGCGFEASLESWYRFLIDPAPYQKMVPVPCFDGDTYNQCRGKQGVDSVLLQQRADFLRPDSLVGVVMLTDEDDCSVIDDKQYFLALQALDGTSSFHLARGTAACESDPYGPDCKSCWEVDTSSHPECASGWANPETQDRLNLRCHRQKQRFGIDFLNPVERYITGLTSPTLEDGSVNPLFCSQPNASGTGCATEVRDRSRVVLMGIVGVPWQDIARNPQDLQSGYKPGSEIDWNLVLGNPMANVEPTDPLMVASVEPRAGSNPVTGETLSGPGDPTWNMINGSERPIPQGNDLQYACIFRLPEPLDCSNPENAFGCDCNQSPENPLCWNGTSYGTMQYYGKAYPAQRHLSVIQGIGDQGLVASICPANLDDPGKSDFGYHPAVSGLIARLAANLK
jgi:hypothetical protein